MTLAVSSKLPLVNLGPVLNGQFAIEVVWAQLKILLNAQTNFFWSHYVSRIEGFMVALDVGLEGCWLCLILSLLEGMGDRLDGHRVNEKVELTTLSFLSEWAWNTNGFQVCLSLVMSFPKITLFKLDVVCSYGHFCAWCCGSRSYWTSLFSFTTKTNGSPEIL